MRIRSIKPEFFEDEELSALPPFARLLFIGTWLMADKNGVFENRPRLIQVKVFPYDSSSAADVSKLLPQLIQGGFLVPFEADGKAWLWIPSFGRHQRICGTEAKNESRNPLPPDDIDIMEATGKQLGSNEEALGLNGARKGKGSLERERERERSGRFVPPTAAEVQEYMYGIGKPIDAEAFIDYWQSAGWKRKSGPVKDWQSTARNWYRNMRPDEHITANTEHARRRAAAQRAAEDAARASQEEAYRLQRERVQALMQAPTPGMLARVAELEAEFPTITQEMRLRMAALDAIEGEQSHE